jgi:two-component system sensor histidine kinase UhpB
MKTKLHVLLCEDDEMDAALVIRQLEKENFEVAWDRVDNAAELTEALTREVWDIVLSDFNIPGFGGPQALAIVKHSGLDIPFILVSGAIGEETAVGMMKKGASDYLMKGSLQRLGEAVKRELEEFRIRKAQQEAESIIRANEEKYRAVIDNSLYAIFLAPPAGRIQESNPAATAMFGYTREEFTQLDRYSILDTNDDNLHAKIIERDEKERMKGEFTGIRKNGERFPCEVASVLFHDIHGNRISCSMIADISARRNAEQQLRNTLAEMQQLSEHLKNAREDERKFIAREIHDEVGQLATAIQLQLHLLKLKSADLSEAGLEKIDRSMELSDMMISSIRRIATSIRPIALDERGLNDALQWQCEQLQENHHIHCRFTKYFDDSKLSPEAKTEFFRICQESITNVMRHAQASLVEVSIREEEGNICLRIKDNGKGFDTNQKTTHLGLIGLRERAHSLKGELILATGLGHGTLIEVVVPNQWK